MSKTQQYLHGLRDKLLEQIPEHQSQAINFEDACEEASRAQQACRGCINSIEPDNVPNSPISVEGTNFDNLYETVKKCVQDEINKVSKEGTATGMDPRALFELERQKKLDISRALFSEDGFETAAVCDLYAYLVHTTSLFHDSYDSATDAEKSWHDDNVSMLTYLNDFVLSPNAALANTSIPESSIYCVAVVDAKNAGATVDAKQVGDALAKIVSKEATSSNFTNAEILEGIGSPNEYPEDIRPIISGVNQVLNEREVGNDSSLGD